MHKGAVVITLSLLAGACAPYQHSGYPAPQYPQQSGSAPTPPYEGTTESASGQIEEPATAKQEIRPVKAESVQANPAIASLLEQAWSLHHAGEFDRSNAVAERAQRLNGSVAETYLVLASNYFAMAELVLAEQVARQGLPFSSGQRSVEQRLKQIIRLVAEVDY